MRMGTIRFTGVPRNGSGTLNRNHVICVPLNASPSGQGYPKTLVDRRVLPSHLKIGASHVYRLPILHFSSPFAARSLSVKKGERKTRATDRIFSKGPMGMISYVPGQTFAETAMEPETEHIVDAKRPSSSVLRRLSQSG